MVLAAGKRTAEVAMAGGPCPFPDNDAQGQKRACRGTGGMKMENSFLPVAPFGVRFCSRRRVRLHVPEPVSFLRPGGPARPAAGSRLLPPALRLRGEVPATPASGSPGPARRRRAERVAGSTAPWRPARVTAAPNRGRAGGSGRAAGTLALPLAARVPQPSCLPAHLGFAVSSCVILTRYLTCPVFSFVRC